MSTTTRRLFLQATTATAVSCLSSPGLVMAQMPTDRRFVLVILRGAMDGLSAVPPVDDADYRDLRGALAIGPESGAHSLGASGFALHPALPTLAGLYARNDAAVLHAIASPYRDRSHFDGQDLLEFGTSTVAGVRDGWLNRALGRMSGDGRRLGIALGHAMPLVLRGDVPVASWAPSVLPGADADIMARLSAMYRADPSLSPVLEAAIGTTAMAENVLEGSGMGPAFGPREGRVLAEAAGAFLSNPEGPRLAVLSISGWDTHTNQGTTTGRLARALGDLDTVIETLQQGLAAVWERTAIAVVTEFGRTVRPNGSGGTDHGTASAAFLVGGAIAGGQMITQWPGLSGSALHEGRDLAPTMDLRTVFKTVLTGHLGLAREDLDAHVFSDARQVPVLPGLFAS